MFLKTTFCCIVWCASISGSLGQNLVRDSTRFFDNPSSSSYGSLRTALQREFGSSSNSVVSENVGSYYRVEGSGPVQLNFRFLADTGGFNFSFGYYKMDSSLASIDTSTDDGRLLYASNALSPSNSVMLFDDLTQNAISSSQATVNGGDVLGFFLIPNTTLDDFRRNTSRYEVNSTAWNKRWPLFSDSNANPAGKDQLLSFSGESGVTGGPVNFFGWEDLTRSAYVSPSELNYHDMVFAVDGASLTSLTEYPLAASGAGGLAAVPEPGVSLLGTIGILSLLWMRSRK